jgi:hypothetical protein
MRHGATHRPKLRLLVHKRPLPWCDAGRCRQVWLIYRSTGVYDTVQLPLRLTKVETQHSWSLRFLYEDQNHQQMRKVPPLRGTPGTPPPSHSAFRSRLCLSYEVLTLRKPHLVFFRISCREFYSSEDWQGFTALTVATYGWRGGIAGHITPSWRLELQPSPFCGEILCVYSLPCTLVQKYVCVGAMRHAADTNRIVQRFAYDFMRFVPRSWVLSLESACHGRWRLLYPQGGRAISIFGGPS